MQAGVTLDLLSQATLARRETISRPSSGRLGKGAGRRLLGGRTVSGADYFLDKSKDFATIPRLIGELLDSRQN